MIYDVYQIYIIQNLINGKTYIGKSLDYIKRFKRHLRNADKKINRYLYDSINHHGKNNFLVSLLEEWYNVDAEFINSREMALIAHHNSFYPHGYNMTLGGDGGNTISSWSDEDKKALYIKQAKSRSGRKCSDETKKLLSDMFRNRIISDEHKLKISETNKLRKIMPPKEYWKTPGCDGFFLGKNHSKESREKMSEFRKGKKYEDYMDEATILKLKNKKRDKFSGKNNPKYVDFNTTMKREIVEFLIDNNVNMSEISKNFKISEYKLRIWFNEIGIAHYQIFRRCDIVEWNNFWRKVYVD